MPGRYMYPTASPQKSFEAPEEPLMQSTPTGAGEQTTVKVSFKEEKRKVSKS